MPRKKLAWNSLNGQMSLREALLFALIGALLLLAFNRTKSASLFNDSYQYLSVASNIARGQGIVTSLIHFDAERSEGRIPAPMTTFAPGYPVAAALASSIMSSVERGACFVSIAASSLSALLVWALASFIRLDRLSTQLAIALVFLNGFFLHFSSAILSEPLFLFVSLAAVLAVASSIGDLRGQPPSTWRLVFGQILVAAAYSVRYAGLFLFAAVLLHAALSFALVRNRHAFRYLVSNAISAALMGIIITRNIRLVGDWKGGNGKHVSNSLAKVLGDYLRSQIHLLFGDHVFDIWLIAALAFAVLALLWAAWRLRSNRPQWASLLPSGGFLLLLYPLISTAGLIYLGKTSDISFGERMFYPLLPLYAVGALSLLQRAARTSSLRSPAMSARPALALFFMVLYGVANLRGFPAPQAATMEQQIEASFQQPLADRPSLPAWIDANLVPGEAIAADAGQPTGFLLHRPALSLVESEYSNLQWDQANLISQMRALHIRYLILNLALSPAVDPVRSESGFLAQAICCRISPGLHVVAENSDIRVFQLDNP